MNFLLAIFRGCGRNHIETVPEFPNIEKRFTLARPTVKKLQLAAAGCKDCHLWKTGTQTVFGEGSRRPPSR